MEKHSFICFIPSNAVSSETQEEEHIQSDTPAQSADALELELKLKLPVRILGTLVGILVGFLIVL